MMPRPYIPRATYRLQLNRDFIFVQATAIVPYLATLGISHCGISPFLKARPGSMHGYDIVDHNSLNPEIGTPQEFDRFVAILHQHGMGLIVDIAPNHMGVMGSDNAWWLDVRRGCWYLFFHRKSNGSSRSVSSFASTRSGSSQEMADACSYFSRLSCRSHQTADLVVSHRVIQCSWNPCSKSDDSVSHARPGA